ncbi:MAG TPA: HEPN domain-containing protein [Deltaproteobacteria bacterium]|nr:HEPN domain-containing protein [Deltaproteobacteria bacterium]
MDEKTHEWIKQADFDSETAEFMFEGGRYFYAVFMCHLSLEKALKGIYCKIHGEVPPKMHNLVFLINKTGMKPPEAIGKFIVKLNEANIATRYPESLEKLQKIYTKEISREMISQTKEALKWIKQQL